MAISNSDWIAQPSGSDLARVYPFAAKRANTAGAAVIQCLVEANGALSACKVTSEQPEGLGFGDAALKLAPKFRMRTHLSGQPVGGGTVRIPVTFFKY